MTWFLKFFSGVFCSSITHTCEWKILYILCAQIYRLSHPPQPHSCQPPSPLSSRQPSNTLHILGSNTIYHIDDDIYDLHTPSKRLYEKKLFENTRKQEKLIRTTVSFFAFHYVQSLDAAHGWMCTTNKRHHPKQKKVNKNRPLWRSHDHK